MNRNINRLKKLVEKNLYKSKSEIVAAFGKPTKRSDNCIWFYNRYQAPIFRDEISFTFEEEKVVDVVLTQYILWIEIRSIFYYEGQNPEYKMIQLFKK